MRHCPGVPASHGEGVRYAFGLMADVDVGQVGRQAEEADFEAAGGTDSVSKTGANAQGGRLAEAEGTVTTSRGGEPLGAGGPVAGVAADTGEHAETGGKGAVAGAEPAGTEPRAKKAEYGDEAQTRPRPDAEAQAYAEPDAVSTEGAGLRGGDVVGSQVEADDAAVEDGDEDGPLTEESGALDTQRTGREKGTKRYVELAYELASERFRVTLDKDVRFLESGALFNHHAEAYLEMVSRDTKVLECHLHEKLSDNQHFSSLRLAHLQCWDLHVGAQVNLFGRATTLMSCDLATGEWLEYHAAGLRAIKEAMERTLRKYEQVPLKGSLKDSRGENKVKREWEQGSNMPSVFRARGSFLPATNDMGARGKPAHVLGGDDLRTLLHQVDTFCDRLAHYRPKVAADYAELVRQFTGKRAGVRTVDALMIHER